MKDNMMQYTSNTGPPESRLVTSAAELPNEELVNEKPMPSTLQIGTSFPILFAGLPLAETSDTS